MSLARPCEPPPSRRTVVFLAFGTRGDVQPLAIICRALATSSDDLFAVFVTHQEHRAWLARLLAATAAGVVYVDTPAALGAPDLEPADGSRKRAARDEEALWSSQQRRACVDASARACVVVFNLFAMEGAHLADLLGARAVAIHPYPMPHATSRARLSLIHI